MTASQIISKLEALNAEIYLIRQVYSYIDENARWSCSIEIKGFGQGKIQLKADASGPDHEAAIVAAFDKIAAIIDSTPFAVAFEVPRLTLNATPEAKADDEMPF